MVTVARAVLFGDAAIAPIAGPVCDVLTAAHSSNLLVDPEGGLYTIDFEYCARTAGEELDKLFANVRSGRRAFESLRPISKLSKWEIAELFEGLPEWIEWPLGSKEAAVEHYAERLRKWKTLFRECDRN